jgi:hypothetical protein
MTIIIFFLVQATGQINTFDVTIERIKSKVEGR